MGYHEHHLIMSYSYCFCFHCMINRLRASERSERSEHTVVLSLRFYYIYIYSVTKILRKIRATTFTENYGKLRVRGMSTWMSERHFQLVLVAQPVTCSLPARIQCLIRHKPLKLFFFGLHEANLYTYFEIAISCTLPKINYFLVRD